MKQFIAGFFYFTMTLALNLADVRRSSPQRIPLGKKRVQHMPVHSATCSAFPSRGSQPTPGNRGFSKIRHVQDQNHQVHSRCGKPPGAARRTGPLAGPELAGLGSPGRRYRQRQDRGAQDTYRQGAMRTLHVGLFQGPQQADHAKRLPERDLPLHHPTFGADEGSGREAARRRGDEADGPQAGRQIYAPH